MVTFESLKPYWLVKKNYDDEISKVRSAIRDKSGLDAADDELEYDDSHRRHGFESLRERGSTDADPSSRRTALSFFTRDRQQTQFVRSRSHDLRRQDCQILEHQYHRQVETFARSLECRRRRCEDLLAADARRREELADPSKAADLRDVID